MKTVHIFLLFIAVALIQLFVPAQIILKQETIISKGNTYKFKTRPVDPNDPFRGKYITLDYAIRSFKTNDSLWENKQTIFVYLTTDSLGYAKIDTVSRDVLIENENDYFIATAKRYNKYTGTVNIDLPFNRYYMEETKAFDAEIAVRNRQRDSLPDNTYGLVHVKKGEAVLTDVIIDDISIKDYVEMEDNK